MPKMVIADTSCLIIFDKIKEFEILKGVYREIYTTPEVLSEFGKSLPVWIKIISVKDKKYQKFVETLLDKCESSVLALAIEQNDSILIVDDIKARKFGKQIDINFTGTLGVINKAKELKLIDQIKPVIDKLKETNFRISNRVIDNLLKMNNE